jgi:hypothetical protein
VTRRLACLTAWVLPCLLVAVVASAAAAATRYDPRLRFRTLSTPRFDIHYHQGGEVLARRLAAIVEAAATSVDEALGPAAGRVQVILVDQHDLANGWATPLPYNTIEINAAAPGADSIIGNTDDWLRMVFVHEYAHIAHLSRAGGWVAGLRKVFGRHPWLVPSLYQPIWGIEGLATWQETATTSQGRLPAGDFRLVLERAAAAGRFEPMDRAAGGNVDWPAGLTPYVYGAYFHDFLAARYGQASLRRLADETARLPPYFVSRAYRRVYGRSAGDLWREFASATSTDVPAPDDAVTRLTTHGFDVSGPRHGSDGRIFYAVVNPRHFPALMAVRPGETPTRVTTRFLGRAIGVTEAGLVVDEIDQVRSVGLQSDLYLVDPETGRRRRLTRAARLADPDVGPGGVIVCTLQTIDGRALAILPSMDAGDPEVLTHETSTDFASPRWSPDGRFIAAERRRVGASADIVLVDPATGLSRVLVSLPGGRSATPTWTPDGSHVLFAAAADGNPFRIHRVRISDGAVEILEGTGAQARSPDVSPDGTSLVYVGYTADGHDLFSMPLARARWRPVTVPAGAEDSTSPASELPTTPEDVAVAPRRYSPVRTLWPTSWTPVVESTGGRTAVGAATGGVDALGRHAYALGTTWSRRGGPDGHVAYAYDGWRPTLFVAARAYTDRWQDETYVTREVAAGMLLRVSSVRAAHTTLAAFQQTEEHGPALARYRRAALRAGWELTTARAFGYSVSAEEGGSVGATIELPRRAFGSEGNGVTVTAVARRYRRFGPPHAVVAWRVAGGGSWGDREVGRLLSASGPGPQSTALQFGRGAIGLLRGYAVDEVAGRRAATLNLDYRLPLVRVGRGYGTWPVFVRHLHGAVFLDIGHAWDETPRWTDRRLSAGVELSAASVVGFVLPLTATAGVAVRQSTHGGPRDVAVFGRIGRAF